MDLNSLINDANPNVVIFLLTTLIAFLSWLVKSLVDKPLANSKITFTKYFEKRIEILSEINTRLKFIAYFPVGKDSLEFKNQLQLILLQEGKAAYLSKELHDNVIRISIDPATNEKLLLLTINNLEVELALMISKIRDEIIFYRKFSNYKPLKRFMGIMLLSLQYLLSLLAIVSFILLMIITFLNGNIYLILGIIAIALLFIFLIDKWLKS